MQNKARPGGTSKNVSQMRYNEGVQGRCGAPQHGLDPRTQLGGTEWLRDIIVRTEFQPHDFLGFVGLGGEHDDAGLKTTTSQLTTDLESVLARQYHIEENEIERPLPSTGSRGVAPVTGGVGYRIFNIQYSIRS